MLILSGPKCSAAQPYIYLVGCKSDKGNSGDDVRRGEMMIRGTIENDDPYFRMVQWYNATPFLALPISKFLGDP